MLSWPQLRLLQLIYEPFQQYGHWPTFQHVNALAWHELKTPTGHPLEPRHVYYELSASGLVRPPVQRDRTWELREETVLAVTFLGLTHLDAAVADVGSFVNAVRYIGERAHNFRPASPATPEHLQITSEEIRLTLRLDVGDRALLRLAYLLQQEASGIWTSFSGPDPGAGWSLTVDADVARRYRNVAIAYDVLDVQDELRRAYAPTAFQYGAFGATSEEPTMVVNGDRAARVFISYSHSDQEFVLALVEQLKRHGVRVWIDQVELVVGDSLVKRIGDAIEEGDFVVGVISPHSVKSSWCQKELALAVTRGINEKRVTVLPIRLGDVKMPSFLTDVLYAEGDNPTEIADELTRAIETHLKRAGIEATIAPAQPLADSEVAAAPERAQAISPGARGDVLTLLDEIAQRVDEVLIQWDRCRNAGGATDDLTAEQRRLRTLLERVPDDLRRALPLTSEITHATWQDFFRIRESASAEPDLREELRAVRTQVAQGLPIVARWSVTAGPDEVSSGGRDASAYRLEIERDDESRAIVVYISGTAMASSNEYLSADVVAAKTTRGRSVVTNLLSVDDPPREVMVSTEGVRWDLQGARSVEGQPRG